MGIELNENADHVAKAFVSARHEARALPVYPGVAPHDLGAAYVIQDRAISVDGREVAGWKVGRINSPRDGQLGANRLSGPIFADSIVDAAAGDEPQMPVFVGGFAAAEAEMLLHVAPGFAGPVPTDDAATIAILDDVRLGIEIASSPYPGINADGPAVTASDFGNNAGLVLGKVLADADRLDLCAIDVSVAIDNAPVGAARAATMLDGPFGAVRFLLANLAARGFDLSAGLWVSTGAVTGVHRVAPGQTVDARFGEHGSVSCRIVAAGPR